MNSSAPATAASTGHDEISMIVARATEQHPRQTEASILPLHDGRLLLAYIDFYDGRPKDGHPARLMGRWSQNTGRSWSAPFLLQENIGRMNVMLPSLLQLPTGRILFLFLRKDAQGDAGVIGVMLKHSDDAGATWSQPREISTGVDYWCPANDRRVRLSTGRLLMPIQHPRPTRCLSLISDDDGVTWRHGRGVVVAPEGKDYEEPVIAEAADGALMMYIRTEIKGSRMQFMHVARSTDAGETWTMSQTPGPSSAFSPAIVKRLPGSSDMLMIWNNNMTRSNLTAALSRDGGITWANFRILEEQEDFPMSRSHAYPSLAFSDGNAHMTYWETHKHPRTVNMFHLVYRRLAIAWFYETRKRRPAVYDPARELLIDPSTSEYDGEGTEHKVNP